MKIKRTQGNKVVNITVDFEKEEIYGKFKLAGDITPRRKSVYKKTTWRAW